MIIKKSHFKLNNPTLEENLLPYQKKKRFLFIVMLFLYHAQYHSEISLILLKCNILSIVSKVNKVLSKIRSCNFKFSLRFWPNNWIQIFLLPCLPVNPTLGIVSYFFHLIIQKLFINFFSPLPPSNLPLPHGWLPAQPPHIQAYLFP